MSELRISKIRIDGGTQTRDTRCEGTVQEYAESMSGGAKFPPIVVFYDGENHWLADGFHRVDAASFAGKKSIDADVRQGTRRDAILFSVGANSEHGLRRTNSDKRRAVLLLLNDDEWSNNSDRWIAEQCGVHHKFVAKMREVATVATSDSPRTGQDGKKYTKKPKPRPKAKEPELEVEPTPKPRVKFELVPVRGNVYDEHDEVETESNDEVESNEDEDDEYDDYEEPDIAKAGRIIFEVSDFIEAAANDFPKSRLFELRDMVGKWHIVLERACNETRNN